MKYLICYILFLVLFTQTLYSQNWNTTPTQQSNHFLANKKLKYIQVDSVQAIAIGDSNFHFYKTYRDSTIWNTASQCIDTNAASWFGHFKHRNETDGTEQYKNYKGDSIAINTYANLGDTWIMLAENATDYIQATISVVDTFTIDGGLDSIKKISLQRITNGLPNIAYYNNYNLVISKNNGWITTTDLYNFEVIPKSPHNSFRFPVYNSNDLFIKIPYTLSSTLKTSVDLNAKFHAGNEWQYYAEFSNNGNNHVYIHDSVISSIPLTNGQFICIIHHTENGNRFNPSIGQNFPINIDTIMQVTADSSYTCFFNHANSIPYNREQSFSDIIKVENKKYSANRTSFEIDSAAKNHFQIKSYSSTLSFNTNGSCVTEFISVSGGIVTLHQEFNAKIGNTYFKFAYASTGGVIPPYQYNLIYAKIKNDIYGIKINLKTLALNQEKLQSYTIFPNPANNNLIINFTNANDVHTISIIGIDGKVYKQVSAKQHNNIDIADLSSGLYLINLVGNQLNYYDKFIKL